MMKNVCTILLPAILATGLAAPAWADKGKNERKEEFWDGNCKVERKWKKNGEYKEKRECEAPAREVRVVAPHPQYAVGTPAVVVYPPWIRVQQGQPVYQPGWELPPRPATTPQPVPSQQPVHHCNTATGAAILGGIIGGVAGHQVGGGSGKTVATIGGAIAGVLIGGEIGKRIDTQNQACIGQALEVAPAGQQLSWNDPNNANVQYGVVPGNVEKHGNTYCRPYTATLVSHGQQQQVNRIACRQPDGTWVSQQ